MAEHGRTVDQQQPRAAGFAHRIGPFASKKIASPDRAWFLHCNEHWFQMPA
jgi:hypothetical protein